MRIIIEEWMTDEDKLNLSLNEAAVYAIIYGFTKNGGVCYASLAYLAQKVKCSPNTVGNIIKRLEKAGLIKKWHENGKDGRKRNHCKIIFSILQEKGILKEIAADCSSGSVETVENRDASTMNDGDTHVECSGTSQSFGWSPPASVKNNKKKEKRDSESGVCAAQALPPDFQLYGEFHNIKLKNNEYQNLVNTYGDELVSNAVINMSLHMQANGKTYKDCYARLKAWCIQDRNRQQARTYPCQKKSVPKSTNSEAYRSLIYNIDEYEPKNTAMTGNHNGGTRIL